MGEGVPFTASEAEWETSDHSLDARQVYSPLCWAVNLLIIKALEKWVMPVTEIPSRLSMF